ncbi:hypothetical protein [Sphingopyxis fribergensis]
MSGPKVVRIVTREEILAICNGQLARVDAALADWKQIGAQFGDLDAAALAQAEERRAALAVHIAAGRFVELQKEAPLEQTFLRADIEARLAAAARREAAARVRGRREKEAGRSLVAALDGAGQTIDADLRRRLEAGDAAALAAGFAALGAQGGSDAASREQASKLGEGVARGDFAAWLAAAEADDEHPEIARLEARISEIALLAEAAPVDDWRARLDAAASADDRRRPLLLDALGGEVRRALDAAKARMRLAADLSGRLAEADAAGLDTAAWRQDIAGLDQSGLAERVAAVAAALDAHRAAEAARERRGAVLAALAELGYEVREEMMGAWAQQGELVLANPSRPGYGMEVRGGGAAAERIQMRAVAFEGTAAGSDLLRDHDAETLWCGDIMRLRAQLGEDGGRLDIEKALEIGAVPLKRVAAEGGPASIADTLPAPGRRTLPKP